MSLQRVIAAPFQQAGAERLSKQELVVGLSLHRDWYSPDQAKVVVERAVEEGIIRNEDDEFIPTFDPGSVSIPRDFRPDGSILTRQSPLERILGEIEDSGIEKREAVAAINRSQRDLNVTIEAAAALYASKHEIPLEEPLSPGQAGVWSPIGSGEGESS